MKKKILQALRLITALALVIMLPIECLAAGNMEDLSGDIRPDKISMTLEESDSSAQKIGVTIQSAHAAAEKVSSLQFSLELKGAGDSQIEFAFSEETKKTSTAAEYRYDQSSGRMNIYLAGTNPLFNSEKADENGYVSLNIGSITLPESVSSVSPVSDSLKYVYGTDLIGKEIGETAGIAKASISTELSGADLELKIGDKAVSGKTASLYGSAGNEVVATAPEQVTVSNVKYDFDYWQNTVDNEKVSEETRYSFTLMEAVSLKAVYKVSEEQNPKITVTGGTITRVNDKAAPEGTTEGHYPLNTLLTIEAEEAITEDGVTKNFAGWYLLNEDGTEEALSYDAAYQFYVKASAVITAKYNVEETIPEPTVVLSNAARTADSAGKETVVLTASIDVPDELEVIGEGIVRAYKDLGKDGLKIGESGVTTHTSKTVFRSGNYTYSFTIAKTSANKKKSIYARGYVKYKDVNGDVQVKYSEIKELSPIQN